MIHGRNTPVAPDGAQSGAWLLSDIIPIEETRAGRRGIGWNGVGQAVIFRHPTRVCADAKGVADACKTGTAAESFRCRIS